MIEKRKLRTYRVNKLLLARRFQFQVRVTERNCVDKLQHLSIRSDYEVNLNTDVHPYKYRIDKISSAPSGKSITAAVIEGEFYEEVNMGVTFVKGIAYAGDAAGFGWFFIGCTLLALLLTTLGVHAALCGVVLMPVASFGSFVNSLAEREVFIQFIEHQLSQ